MSKDVIFMQFFANYDLGFKQRLKKINLLYKLLQIMRWVFIKCKKIWFLFSFMQIMTWVVWKIDKDLIFIQL